MLAKWVWIMLWLAAGSLVITACTPALRTDGNPAMEGNSTMNDSLAMSGGTSLPENGTAAPDDGTVLNESGSGMDQNAPGSSGGQGQSGPGAGSGSDAGRVPPGQEAATPSAVNFTYTDSGYKFAIQYPSNFVFRARAAEKVAGMSPRPIAAFVMLSPTMAFSDVADLLPADIDLRLYEAGAAASAERWLETGGLLDGFLPPEAFRTDHVSGIKVCPSTMIAPGCSYLVLGDGFVYQLTPASLVGEAMLKTFSLLP